MSEDDPQRDEYSHAPLDGSEPPSAAVVRTVAELSGIAPGELDPLYDVVDPDALDRLFGSAGPGDAYARFTYCGYKVLVSGEEWITVTNAE